jgi:VWFA-related protein
MLTAALLTAAHGQDVPPSIIRVSVDRVQIGAVVTDTKGAHVTNLGIRDFTILDGGKSQQLTSCEYIRLVNPETARVTAAAAAPSSRGLTSIPAAGAQQLTREETQRSIVFLVDDLSFQPPTIPSVREALVSAIQQNLRPTDMAALIRTSSGNSSLEQFTSDRRVLLESVTKISWRPEGSGNPGIMRLAGPLAHVSGVNGTANNRTVQVIQYVISAMRDLPGRKAIFLISQSLAIGGGYTGPRSDMASVLGVLVDRALRSGVVIYSVDPTPLSSLTVDASYDETGDILAMQSRQPGPMPRETSSQVAIEAQRRVQGYTVRELAWLEFSRAGLRLLSEGTGGQMAADTDVANALGRFAGDLEGYYLLTYRPSSADRYFGAKRNGTPFRSVKVRVAQASLHVRSYAGYVPMEDAAEPDPSAQIHSVGLGREVGQALFSPFAARGVHIDVIPTFTASNTVSPELSLLVRIDAHDIAFTTEEDGRHDARIDLVARAGSEWNEPGEVVSKEVVLHLKEESFKEAMRIGLDFFGARYFSSAQGRFTSPDWSEKPEPIPYADLENPQSLNLYTYVHNNPLRSNDPDGHCTSDGKQKGFWWCLFHYSDQDALNEARGYCNNNAVAYNGSRVDPSKMTDQQLLAAWKAVNDQWKAIAATGAHPGAVMAGMAVNLSLDKLQHIYDKHASDFGVSGNKNPEQIAKARRCDPGPHDRPGH